MANGIYDLHCSQPVIEMLWLPFLGGVTYRLRLKTIEHWNQMTSFVPFCPLHSSHRHVFRLTRTILHVKIAVTPKFPGVSPPARASSTCVATTSTTSLATVSPGSPRLCPCTCSAARSWTWKAAPSVGWRDWSTCTCQRMTSLLSALMPLKV